MRAARTTNCTGRIIEIRECCGGSWSESPDDNTVDLVNNALLGAGVGNLFWDCDYSFLLLLLLFNYLLNPIHLLFSLHWLIQNLNLCQRSTNYVVIDDKKRGFVYLVLRTLVLVLSLLIRCLMLLLLLFSAIRKQLEKLSVAFRDWKISVLIFAGKITWLLKHIYRPLSRGKFRNGVSK